jgi:hypothetical protein
MRSSTPGRAAGGWLRVLTQQSFSRRLLTFHWPHNSAATGRLQSHRLFRPDGYFCTGGTEATAYGLSLRIRFWLGEVAGLMRRGSPSLPGQKKSPKNPTNFGASLVELSARMRRPSEFMHCPPNNQTRIVGPRLFGAKLVDLLGASVRTLLLLSKRLTLGCH